MTNILWYRSFPPPKWLTNTYGWQCTKDTKCQKQSLVARAGIVFPRLESGVIEAEVGERKRGIVLTGWETAHALRVESRMRLEFLACSIDSAAIEKHHRGDIFLYPSLTISTNETKKHALNLTCILVRFTWDLSWKSENWSSIFANERVISSCSGGGKVFKIDGREPSLTLKEARPRASLKIHRVVTLSILCKLSIPLHPVSDHKSTFDYVI